MKEKVSNCDANVFFDVDVKNPLTPIDGSGIVLEWRCGKSSERPDGNALLVADPERSKLICKAVNFCDYCIPPTQNKP